jgi:hypothetical protein
MKRFTPSELPIGTVIDDQAEGTFRKDGYGIWAEVSHHCIDCQEIVYDEGPLAAYNTLRGEIIQVPSNEYFKDFKILALPLNVVEYIVEEFAKATGSETVIDDAIENFA